MTGEVSSRHFTASDGVRLHVLEAGPQHAGPVIAFIPGWSMPAAMWRAQLAALGATHRVAALDPRGQGESEVSHGGYHIDRRADDVHEFVARYPRVVLVGWSLGALEALHYIARRGATALAALVLVDTSVGEDPPPAPGGRFRDALMADRRAAIEGFVRDMFRTPRPAPELAALVDAALRMPLEASLSLFPAGYPREYWRSVTRAFARPLLYVVTPRFAGQAKALRRHRAGTRISVFKDSGHALFADAPERFNRLLADFVRGLTGAYGARDRPCSRPIHDKSTGAR